MVEPLELGRFISTCRKENPGKEAEIFESLDRRGVFSDLFPVLYVMVLFAQR